MLVKMSKSRGNVVLPEEVIRGIYTLAAGYEFRDRAGCLVNWKLVGVWLQSGRGYLTSTKYGRQPVFLHEIDDPVPVLLPDWETVQHPEEIDYWADLLEEFEDSA